jgi:parallel beta-helix repeat protein
MINSNLIANCAVGIAVKDQSEPEIINNEFRSNEIAISAYQKKKVFGGVDAVIHESRFYDNTIVSKADEVSSVSLIESIVDGVTYNEK